jgi:transcriptional regulator with XRE-family HTH domain
MVKQMDTIGKRIRKLRDLSGMPQLRLAELLGIQRTTLSQIENDERKVYAEELIKLSDIFGVSVDYLLDLEKGIEVNVIDEMKKDKASPSLRINIPQKNLRKFKEVLIYILNKIGSKPNVGETLIYKLLYFIDFNFYEKYEEQLIGATYIKNKYGPTPVEFKKIIDKMIASKELEKVKSEYFKYPQTKYLPLRKADLSILKAHEKETIDIVLEMFSDMTAKEISEYSHNDVPWITTEKGKSIEYESVFYRTKPYSVRKYVEDI